MLNWAILKHPINWVTVFLMCFIGMMLLNLILSPWHVASKNTDALSENSSPGPILSPIQ